MVRVDDRYDIGPGVMLITLDRPDRRNALDHSTLLELLDAQHRAAGARVVVLTGAAPAFCAGADISGVESDVFLHDLARVLRGFTELAGAVIGAIAGPALGAGAQLAAVCDLRVATPDSVFGVPAARLGLAVDHWTVDRITSQFGAAVARAMLLAATTYTGDDLHTMGSVHRLGDLDAALAWAGEVARLAPLTIAAHKLAFESSEGGQTSDRLIDGARRRAWASADAAEGRQAFLDKRAPEFRGE
jgi:enoyl-CoA hydratase